MEIPRLPEAPVAPNLIHRTVLRFEPITEGVRIHRDVHFTNHDEDNGVWAETFDVKNLGGWPVPVTEVYRRDLVAEASTA
jgi:hypothetical protein